MTHKKVKGLLVSALAVVTALALSIPAFAAGITVNGAGAGHEYEAYQIIAGNKSGAKLDITGWGTGITAAGQTVAKTAASADASATVEQFATAINNSAATAESVAAALVADKATNLTGGVAPSAVSTPGWYLLVDKATTGTYKPVFVLYLGGDKEVNAKGVPGETDKKADNADHTSKQIGQVITYTISATIPDSYDHNRPTAVNFSITDNISAGLTYNNDFAVTLDGTALVEDTDYTVSSPTAASGYAAAKKFDFGDITQNDKFANAGGKTVVVTYTATVNASAVVGANPNEAVIEFDGTTTTDIAKEYLTEFDFTKVIAGTDTALPGAGFKLKDNNANKWYKNDNGTVSWVDDESAATEVVSGAGGKINFTKIAAGAYTLKETTVPEGYRAIADQTITVGFNATTETFSFTGTNVVQASVNNSNVVEGTIANEPATDLPDTGGAGAFIYVGVGLALAVIAAVGLRLRKRA